MRILVFGETGQVARELARRAPVTALGRDAADLSDPEACADAIRASDAEAVRVTIAFQDYVAVFNPLGLCKFMAMSGLGPALAADMVSQERGPTQVVAQPIKLSRTDSSVKHPPPTYSQHTDEILAELGYSAADIAKMHEDGTV